MSNPLPISPPWGTAGGGRAGSGLMMPPNVAASRLGGPIARTLEIPLPEDQPIPDAKEFNILGSIGTAAVQNNVAITGATFDVPTSNLAIVHDVTIYITNMLVTTNVLWSLLWNGQPLPGYQNLSIFPRVSPYVANNFDSFLRVQGPGTLSVVFSNLDGGTYVVGASFSGWFWPNTSDDRWKSAGE